MKTYYVHSKMIYDTERERQELAWLQQFGEVVNPNGYKGMNFLEPVLECDQVVCSEYKHCIGRGAFDQLQAALNKGIPTYVMRSRRILGGFHLRRVKGIKRFLNNWNYYGTVLVKGGWNRQASKDAIIEQMMHDDYMKYRGTQEF